MRLTRLRLLQICCLVLPLLLFLLYRWASVSLSVDDTNVYFYTAYRLLAGQRLYRDIIFTNLPLFPFISVFYFIISRGSLYLYYFTAAVESVGIVLAVFYAGYLDTKSFLPSLLAAFLYLFSVYNLITSAFQTGILTAALFALAAYILLRKRHPFLTGLFMALCFLTKAYFAPVLLALALLCLTTFPLRSLLRWLGGLLVGASLLLPFLLTSAPQLRHYLIDFSLYKAADIDKFYTAGTFLSYDFALVLIFLFSLCLKLPRRKFWLVMFCLSAIYFFACSSFFYLYFGIIVPFLCIPAAYLFSFLLKKFNEYHAALLLVTFSAGLFLFNCLRYSASSQINRVSSPAQIVNQIRRFAPDRIYGYSLVAPALAYLSHVPLLEDNLIDTNPRLFTAGILDKNRITKSVVSHKTLVVVLGYEDSGLSGDYLPDLVDPVIFHAHCSRLAAYPVFSPPPPLVNQIILFACPLP